MRKILTQLILIFILIPNLILCQSSSYHSICSEKENIEDKDNCTKEAIQFILQKNIIDDFPLTKNYDKVKTKLELKISNTGFITLSDIELNQKNEEIELSIRHAIKRLSYRIHFIPAKDISDIPISEIKQYNFELDIPSTMSQLVDTIKVEGEKKDTISTKNNSRIKDNIAYRESMPRFPGCERIHETDRQKKACADKKMLQYVYGNLIYPLKARMNGIEGIVVVSFTIGEDGKIKDIKAENDIGGGCAEEAIRVIKKMQQERIWIAGYQYGVPVAVSFNMPIKFRAN